jgi:hypothetical protein
LVFDPTRPVQPEWEQILAKVAEKLIREKKKQRNQEKSGNENHK